MKRWQKEIQGDEKRQSSKQHGYIIWHSYDNSDKKRSEEYKKKRH